MVLSCGILGQKQYWKLAIQSKKLQEGVIMSSNCFVPQEMACSDTLMELFVTLDHQWIIIRSRLPASSFWQKLSAITSACSPSYLCHHYRVWDNNNNNKKRDKPESRNKTYLMNHSTEEDLCNFRLSLSFRIMYYLLLQLIVINA